MSVGALSWAFRQVIPPKPKMVLAALADQADERTGKVCYGRTDIPHIAEKSSVPIRSLYRCIAALVRNGYIGRETGRGRNHTNSYWLCLDRAVAESLDDWKWAVGEPLDEPQDIDEDSENTATVAGFNEPLKPAKGGTQNVPLVAHQDSSEKPKNIRPADEKPKNGFSRQAQDVERAKAAGDLGNARLEPGEMPGWTFVIEGTRWWELLVAHHRRIGKPLNRSITGTGKYYGKTGRYVRNEVWATILKPHSTTGPPSANPLADEGNAQIQAT